MVQLTRLDCGLASAGFMRMALAQAVHHCRYRSVFQRHLYDQPMMRGVLSDLALEVEGAVALIVRLARAFDRAATDPREAAYARLATLAAKYWICKTAPSFIYEAMECLGGNGYVEESVLPRLYREAPVNAIWEGSGNVMCLDVLRALRRDQEAADFFAELAHNASPVIGKRGESAHYGWQAGDARRRGRARSDRASRRHRGVRADAGLAATRGGADGIEARTAETLLQRALPEI
jgi:putative acyl-CoA dehydrogenase